MTIKFAKLLIELGHHVTLYGSEENEAPCDELVTAIKKEEQEMLLSTTRNPNGEIEPTPYQYAYIEEWSPLFQLANARIIKEIGKRKEPRDFICSIGGWSQHSVADAHPDLQFVEYSVGYSGSFSPFRVFESYAWMHHTYGAHKIPDGRFFDTVIPCFYEPDDFPFQVDKSANPNPFVLYVGRLIPRKGLEIACRAAHDAGIPLKVIGHGDRSLITHGAEYLGALSESERNSWMSLASAILCPTVYVEPFNQVAIEAQLCGTPVISTDFGGFTETVVHEETGFRCSYLGEFVDAIKKAPGLPRAEIRNRAVKKYSLHSVKRDYQRYFDRLSLLWKKGWETTHS